MKQQEMPRPEIETQDDVEDQIDQTVARFIDHVDPSLGFYMKATLGDVVEWEAEGNYVRDMRGDTWLDALSFMGVFGLGHRHPKVIKAVKEQLDRMPLNARYFFNKPQADLAALLTRIAPGGKIKNAFFSNSGSEAVDAALKTAKFVTQRTEIISTWESYHGLTIGAASVSGMTHFRDGLGPLLPGVKFVHFGDAAELAEAMSDKTAAVFMEPVHAGLGSKMAPLDYFSVVRSLCDRHGALFIDDEVQTGLGRTGKMWGIDHYTGNCAPDIICMGKVLSGGVMPIGATLYSEAVADALTERLILNTSTFGGGELACAAGKAAVEIVIEEHLSEKAAEGGKVFGTMLQKIGQRFPKLIRDVRGVGMMWTIEFTDPLVVFVVFPLMLREHRVLVAPHLNRVDMMRFSPTLGCDHETLGRIAAALEESLVTFSSMDEGTRGDYHYAFQQALSRSVGQDTLENSGLQ
jgi:putrescine aminotransferase